MLKAGVLTLGLKLELGLGLADPVRLVIDYGTIHSVVSATLRRTFDASFISPGLFWLLIHGTEYRRGSKIK